MAKQDIKEYIEGRLKTLLDNYAQEPELNSSSSTSKRIDEVLKMAAHFQIKTKDVLNSHPMGKHFKK